MPHNNYIFPAPGLGYARSSCLAPFASGTPTVSGSGYLSLGDYQSGFIYYFDGQSVVPTQGTGFINELAPVHPPSVASIPSPILFGDWVYQVLDGALPTMQLTGGIEFIGGAFGGISWVPLAYTGIHGLQVQTNFGGVLGFDSELPTLNYTVTGGELFSLSYQVLDDLPQQIEIQLYEPSLGWHIAYVGVDSFGLGGFRIGPVPPIVNNWAQITFTPAQIDLIPGMTITGMAWGAYNQTGPSTVVFSDTSNLNQPNETIGGFIDTCQDGNAGFYILDHTGPLYRIPAIGAASVSIPLSDSPSYDYTGLTFNPVDQSPYFIGYDASVYNYTGATVVTVTPPPSGSVSPARLLFNDGASNLYTLFPASNKIGKYNITGNAWSFITSPFVSGTTDTFYYSHDLSTLLAGGSIYSSLTNTHTINGMVFTASYFQLLTTDSSNNINVYNAANDECVEWSLTQQISGTGAPSIIAAEPDGLQALVLDPTNNAIQILTNVAGHWEPQSPIVSGIADPTAVAIFNNTSNMITQALVCETSQNKVLVLNKTLLIWEIGQTPLTITGPTSVSVVLGSNNTYEAIVTTSTGVTFLQFNGVFWEEAGSAALSPVPTMSASDFVNSQNTYLYAAGSSGGNSTIYAFQNGGLVTSYPVSGTVGTFGVINYQIVSALSTGAINVGAVVDGVYSDATIAGASGPANPDLMTWVVPNLGFIPLLLIANANSIESFYNDASQSVARIRYSQLGIYNGSSWNVVDLDDENEVSSITTDVSGNIFSMLTDNVLYKHSSLGVLASGSGYPYTMKPPLNQEFFIPLGFSKLVWYDNKLISASSLTGGISIISP